MQIIGFSVSKENANCGYMLYLAASVVGKKSMDVLRSEYIEELTQNYKMGLHKRREEKQAAERAKKVEEERVIQLEEDRQRREKEREARRAARIEDQQSQEGVSQSSISDFLTAVANIEQSNNYVKHGKSILDCVILNPEPQVVSAAPIKVEPIYTDSGQETTKHGKSILDCVILSKEKESVEKSEEFEDLGFSYDNSEDLEDEIIEEPDSEEFSFTDDDEELIQEVPEAFIEVKAPSKPELKKEPTRSSIGTTIVGNEGRTIIHDRSPKKPKPKQDYGELSESNVKAFVKANRGCTLRDIMMAFSGSDEKRVVAIVKKAKQTNKIQEKHGKYEV